jgi:hypothetical protein
MVWLFIQLMFLTGRFGLRTSPPQRARTGLLGAVATIVRSCTGVKRDCGARLTRPPNPLRSASPPYPMTLRNQLLRAIPDRPESVEIRGLLLEPSTDLRGDAAGAVLFSAAFSLIALLGAPRDALILDALRDAGDGALGGDGADGWTVIALRPHAHPALAWTRATAMTLRDTSLLERAVDAARACVSPLTRDELARVPADYLAEMSAALAIGTVMCARVDDQLASFAYVGFRSESYFDLSVDTIEPKRGRGLAQLTAAALIVDEQETRGGMPVWSALESNAPSMGAGHKLGFVEVGEVWVVEL